MAFDIHTVSVVPGSTTVWSDRVVLAVLPGVANLAGGSAGVAVTTAVALSLPATYTVHVTPGQDATAYVTAKTTTGFNVVLAPRLAASTLASGTFDVIVVG